MNDRELTQLLRNTDASEFHGGIRDARSIATSARAIRHRRQQRTRIIATATLSLLIAVGSIATLGWRERSNDRKTFAEFQDRTTQMDIDASKRMDVVQTVVRAKKPAAKSAKPRNFAIDLEQERQRAAAIILQAADQLREAGRADLSLDRYHDLIALFPDTTAAALARERLELLKIRT